MRHLQIGRHVCLLVQISNEDKVHATHMGLRPNYIKATCLADVCVTHKDPATQQIVHDNTEL